VGVGLEAELARLEASFHADAQVTRRGALFSLPVAVKRYVKVSRAERAAAFAAETRFLTTTRSPANGQKTSVSTVSPLPYTFRQLTCADRVSSVCVHRAGTDSFSRLPSRPRFRSARTE
jgi:hypothetical protein